MELLGKVLERGCKSVAVVGMAKNTGKTVTLNCLVREATLTGVRLGLTSCGRDGETQDLLWHNPKPTIWAPRGTLLGTARGVLPLASAKLQVIRETQYSSALGAICLVEVLAEGFVQLAGPSFAKHLAAVVRDLSRLGADLVLVDGAFDRLASAAPTVTAGLILATGAVLGPDPEEVLALTKVRVEQIMVPGISQKRLLSTGTRLGAVNLWLEDGSLVDTKLPTAIGESAAIAQLSQAGNIQGILLKGALTEDTVSAVKAALEARGGFILIVSDPTRIFLSPRSWQDFHTSGGQVLARCPLQLLTLTINPYSPSGPSFDPDHFLTLARQTFPHLPVFNPGQGPGAFHAGFSTSSG